MHAPEPVPEAAWPPIPRVVVPPPSAPRIRLHGALFFLTFTTAVFAGAWFWEGGLVYVAAGDWRHALDVSVLGPGLVYASALMAVLTAHEMGHYLACRHHGIPATLPYFIPSIPPIGTFGAVIRIRGVIPSRRALFDVAAAGPLAGFVVAVPLIVAGIALAHPATAPPQPDDLLLGEPVISMIVTRLIHGDVEVRVGSLFGAGWVGMLVTSMNLFPVGQLDGGHAVYAVSRRWHRPLAWTTCLGLGAFVVYEAILRRTFPAYALWLVVLFVLRDRHPHLVDEADDIGTGRRVLAAVLALIFVLSFIPVPIQIAE